MPGSAAIMKRCRDDESLKAQDSVIEAASALAVLSQSPTSTRHASSGSDQSESSDTETDDATVKTTASAATASSTREKITVPFPQKLMEMLNTLESESSNGSLGDQPIFWLPGGDQNPELEPSRGCRIEICLVTLPEGSPWARSSLGSACAGREVPATKHF